MSESEREEGKENELKKSRTKKEVELNGQNEELR